MRNIYEWGVLIFVLPGTAQANGIDLRNSTEQVFCWIFSALFKSHKRRVYC